MFTCSEADRAASEPLLDLAGGDDADDGPVGQGKLGGVEFPGGSVGEPVDEVAEGAVDRPGRVGDAPGGEGLLDV